MSTTHLAQLNIDVLLHLMKFVHPVDRVNLAFAGILKGFDNINRGAILKQRFYHFLMTQRKL
jgi:hypothetical protein